MRAYLAAFILLSLDGFWLLGEASAQPGGRKPTVRGATSNVPTRPGVSRGAAVDQEPDAKPVSRPANRFNASAAESDPVESSIESEQQEPASVARGGSRFGNRQQPDAEEATEADEPSTASEGYRSASLENRNRTRGATSSRKMLDDAQNENSETATEPAPLTNRDDARSLAAQAISVQLNDSHAGVSLAFALNLEHSGAITGYPIRMEQLLASSPDNSARRAAIRAYWNLVISIADHHHALDELDRATQLADSSRDKLAEAAAAAAEARVAETKLIVTAAQFDLASFTPSPEVLPIPADAPLVGEYRTEFAALFGRGPAPLAIKRLSVMLPLYKDQVEARGRAAYAASEALSSSSDLATLKLLCEHRRAFLGSVRDYNEAIADYALQLATPGMPPETVTSMLIVTREPAADERPDLNGSAQRRGSEVIQAGASEPIAAIKPKRIGGFRAQESEAEAAEEENDVLTSDPEPMERVGDMTEAPAKPRARKFETASEEE